VIGESRPVCTESVTSSTDQYRLSQSTGWPSGPPTVHFLTPVGRGYLWPAHFWAELNITYYIIAVLYNHSEVLTSNGTGNGKVCCGSVAYNTCVDTCDPPTFQKLLQPMSPTHSGAVRTPWVFTARRYVSAVLCGIMLPSCVCPSVRLSQLGVLTLTTPTWGIVSMTRLILHVANSCTKFEVSSCSHSRDISGSVKF